MVTPPFALLRYGCPLCSHRFKTLGEKKKHIKIDHEPRSK